MKVLFVQQKPFLAAALKITLQKNGYDLVVLESATQPEKLLATILPAIVIIDVNQPGGLEFVTAAKIKNLPVIALIANGNEELLQEAFDKGADDYIALPLSITELGLRVSILTKEKKKAIA